MYSYSYIQYIYHHPIYYLEIPSTSEVSQIRGLRLGSTLPALRQVHVLYF